MPKKKISIYGIIGDWGLEPPDIRMQLDEANGEDIDVEINSPGGFVYDGLEIYHLFKNYSGHVTFYVMGLAASMASIIPLAGNKIISEEATVWMIHNPIGSLFGADYREAAKKSIYLESMTKMMSRIYAKKTGKSEAKISELMDAETYFFGSESKDFGLSDEIIESSREGIEGRDDAIAYASMEMEDCLKKMKDRDKKEDVEKLAAYFDIENKSEIKKDSPASAGKNKQEVINMTLDQILAEYPAVRIEIESKLKDEYDKGFTAGAKGMTDKIEMAKKYFGSEYPEQIKVIAAEAITGQKSIETLEAVVAVHDMAIEKTKDEAAANEQGKDTSAEQTSQMSNTGVATSTEDVVTMAANDKGGV